jgi:transposase
MAGQKSENRGKRELKWLGVLKRWAASGESMRGFCLREGISEGTFHYWRRRLGRVSGNGGCFVPVRIVDGQRRREDGEEGCQGDQEMQGHPLLEVWLRCGDRVRVYSGCDGATLERVLGLVEARRC